MCTLQTCTNQRSEEDEVQVDFEDSEEMDYGGN